MYAFALTCPIKFHRARELLLLIRPGVALLEKHEESLQFMAEYSIFEHTPDARPTPLAPMCASAIFRNVRIFASVARVKLYISFREVHRPNREFRRLLDTLAGNALLEKMPNSVAVAKTFR